MQAINPPLRSKSLNMLLLLSSHARGGGHPNNGWGAQLSPSTISKPNYSRGGLEPEETELAVTPVEAEEDIKIIEVADEVS